MQQNMHNEMKAEALKALTGGSDARARLSTLEPKN